MEPCLECVQNCKPIDSYGVEGIGCVSALALRFHVVLAAKGEALPGHLVTGQHPSVLTTVLCNGSSVATELRFPFMEILPCVFSVSMPKGFAGSIEVTFFLADWVSQKG